MKRYLQFFLGVISILIGLVFLNLQNEIYVTTWYGVMVYFFIPIGLLVLNNLAEKNFFSKTSFFINQIYRWRSGKYQGIFAYLTYLICILLFIGLNFLISYIIE